MIKRHPAAISAVAMPMPLATATSSKAKVRPRSPGISRALAAISTTSPGGLSDGVQDGVPTIRAINTRRHFAESPVDSAFDLVDDPARSPLRGRRGEHHDVAEPRGTMPMSGRFVLCDRRRQTP